MRGGIYDQVGADCIATASMRSGSCHFEKILCTTTPFCQLRVRVAGHRNGSAPGR